MLIYIINSKKTLYFFIISIFRSLAYVYNASCRFPVTGAPLNRYEIFMLDVY